MFLHFFSHLKYKEYPQIICPLCIIKKTPKILIWIYYFVYAPIWWITINVERRIFPQNGFYPINKGDLCLAASLVTKLKWVANKNLFFIKYMFFKILAEKWIRSNKKQVKHCCTILIILLQNVDGAVKITAIYITVFRKTHRLCRKFGNTSTKYNTVYWKLSCVFYWPDTYTYRERFLSCQIDDWKMSSVL